MSLIRPEARAALYRWREVLAGAALTVLGGWWIYGQVGLMFYVGSFVSMIGMALIIAGAQRGRFYSRYDGPGTVDVDEGQVIYFGPLSGGAVAVRDIVELALIRSGQSPHWQLRTNAETLQIPVDAAGSDALFDAFTALPGLRTERMLSALRDGDAGDIVIWSHTDKSVDRPRLH